MSNFNKNEVTKWRHGNVIMEKYNIKMNNSLNGPNSWLETAEQRVSEHEVDQWKLSKLKHNKRKTGAGLKNIQNPWVNFKKYMHSIWVCASRDTG